MADLSEDLLILSLISLVGLVAQSLLPLALPNHSISRLWLLALLQLSVLHYTIGVGSARWVARLAVWRQLVHHWQVSCLDDSENNRGRHLSLQ